MSSRRFDDVDEASRGCETLVRLREEFLPSPFEGLRHCVVYALRPRIRDVNINVFLLYIKQQRTSCWETFRVDSQYDTREAMFKAAFLRRVDTMFRRSSSLTWLWRIVGQGNCVASYPAWMSAFTTHGVHRAKHAAQSDAVQGSINPFLIVHVLLEGLWCEFKVDRGRIHICERRPFYGFKGHRPIRGFACTTPPRVRRRW